MPAGWPRRRWCCSQTTRRCRSGTMRANGSWSSVRPRPTVSRCLGCYSFPSHVGSLHPDVPIGIEIPTVLEGVHAEFPDARITYMQGVSIDGDDASGIEPSVVVARDQDLVIAMLGDRAGLFGRGTSGEGCDAANMRLPGRQQDLLERLLDTGVPVVVGLIEGRPYALGTAPERAAAIVASFFPGEEGASAIAGVLSGRVEPSGRLPVSVPATPDGQPSSYLGGPLAHRSGTSNLDPTARFPFGHGLSYTRFEWVGPTVGRLQDLDRRVGDGRAHDSKRRRPRGCRGDPVVPARPGRISRAPGRSSDRVRARAARRGRERHRHLRGAGGSQRVYRPRR